MGNFFSDLSADVGQTLDAAGSLAVTVGTAGLATGIDKGQFTGGLDPGGLNNAIGYKGAPKLLNPDSLSSTPTLAQTNTTRLQAQLASESSAAMYGSTLNSGSGLLDSPTTSSRILLGS